MTELSHDLLSIVFEVGFGLLKINFHLCAPFTERLHNTLIVFIHHIIPLKKIDVLTKKTLSYAFMYFKIEFRIELCKYCYMGLKALIIRPKFVSTEHTIQHTSHSIGRGNSHDGRADYE